MGYPRVFRVFFNSSSSPSAAAPPDPPPPAHSRLSLSLHFHPAEAYLADLESSFDICCNTVETSSPDTGLLRARSCSSNRCGPAPPSHQHHFWWHTYQTTFCVDKHQRFLGPTKRRPCRPHAHQICTVGRCPRSSTRPSQCRPQSRIFSPTSPRPRPAISDTMAPAKPCTICRSPSTSRRY
jgi:hypothetical protein